MNAVEQSYWKRCLLLLSTVTNLVPSVV